MINLMPDPAPPRLGVPPAFYFVRHGETDWNREGRLQGQRDVPLNAHGRKQATASGLTLARLLRDAALEAGQLDFVASPLGRTRETMELMRAAMGLDATAYRLDERLKELSFGTWEGLTWPDIRRQDPGRYEIRRRDKWGFAPPGGESYAGLVARLTPVLHSLGEHAVVVAHGGVARVLMVMLTGLDADRATNEDIWQGRVLMFDRGSATWI
jgi:probable phosphoglycerate mutase